MIKQAFTLFFANQPTYDFIEPLLYMLITIHIVVMVAERLKYVY